MTLLGWLVPVRHGIFLEHAIQGLGDTGEILDKSPVHICGSQERPHLSHVAWKRAVRERFRVVKHYCKPTRGYEMAKIVNPWLEELTFLELESNSSMSK